MAQKFQTVISADSHTNEPLDLWWNALGNKYGDKTPRVIDEFRGEKGQFFYSGNQVLRIAAANAEMDKMGVSPEVGYVPDVRVKFQEDAGVAAEILNPTRMLGILHHTDPEVKRACCEVYNDWLAEFCSHAPKRLVGTAVVPTDDIEWAVIELEKTAKRGLKGGAMISLEPPEGHPPYRDRVYDQLWGLAEEIGAPLILHTITGRTMSPFNFYDPKEQEEGPGVMLAINYEVMKILANDFIFGTILDRFPRLKLVCCEFEVSWIASFNYRIDQIQEQFQHRMPLATLKMRASDYMRNRIWHGFIDDPYTLEAVPHVGASQLLWGSDFPHIRSIALDAQDRLAEIVAGVSGLEQDQMVGGNASEVWGL